MHDGAFAGSLRALHWATVGAERNLTLGSALAGATLGGQGGNGRLPAGRGQDERDCYRPCQLSFVQRRDCQWKQK